MTSVFDEVVETFGARGREWYAGERVSQLEHALQCAMRARDGGAGEELIVASLLHDIGHLLSSLSEDCAQQGVDDHHEGLGARWLAQRFGPGVAEPVRLHVEAKRYLCATDPSYFGRLSEASVRSLELQGGPFDDEGVRDFDSQAFAKDALSLRHWDEEAKIEGAVTPGLEDFRPAIETAASRRSHV